MLKNIMKLRSGAASLLAVAISLGSANMAFADRGRAIIGLSRDGSVYLESYRDYARLVSTRNGSVQNIEFPPDTFEVYAVALSSDGKTVIGFYRDANYTQIGFVWTAGSGLTSLDGAFPTGISDDGKITGYQRISGKDYAFVLVDGVTTTAPIPLSSNNASANTISREGTTVVGTVDRQADGTWHAFVWDLQSSTFTDIDTLGYWYSHATLVSKDGSVVAGDGMFNNSNDRVFRWTESGGMLEINPLMAQGHMYVRAMSDDGDVLVGSGQALVGSQTETHAYRYVASQDNTLVGTTHDLGTLGGDFSEALSISGNGKYIVGRSTDGNDEYRGFRWTEDSNEMISVDEWVARSGRSLSYNTYDAQYISDDGSVVVGMTENDTSYVARASGIIEEATFYPTVAAANSVTVQNGVSGANTIMFGAQGNPMRNLLATGQRSVWGTVDSGYDDNGASDGGLALGEFGFGYGIADGITARLSLGGSYTDQDLDVGGSVKQRGLYVAPEISTDLGANVYVTIGGYWGRSSIDSRRGYLNGGSPDYSNGDTDAETWGAKVRFDWLNAVTISNTEITPYAGLSYARTSVDAYSETDGSFPVSYDETKDHSTIARIGADFVHPLTDTVRLLAKAEADYQFEDHSAATSGTLIGIDNFSLAGQDIKKFWVRGGIGAEFDVGGGTASFMVNATTQGQDPDIWVRSNYTVKF